MPFFSTGERNLKAREGIHYGQGEDRSIDTLKAKFDEYCTAHRVPYEENPFFTCMEKAGLFSGHKHGFRYSF